MISRPQTSFAITAPASSAQATLDKKTVERMVLSSLRTPLVTALNAAMPAATDALRAKRAAVKKQLAAAARTGVQETGVRTELERQLAAGAVWAAGQDAGPQASSNLPSLVHLTSAQDHQRTMDLLHIQSLRPGPSGDPKAPNAANVDESKVPPYTLPDPLVMKNGKKVKNAKEWWSKRRPVATRCRRE